MAEIQCLKLLKQVRRKMKLADREFDNYCNVITCNFDFIVTPGQAYPLDSINESIIWQMKPLVVAAKDIKFKSAFLHA